MTRTIRRPTLAYGLFTFLSCFLELGLVVDAMARGRPLWELGILLLVFHAATLLTHLLSVPRSARAGSLALGSLLLLAHPGGVVGTGVGVFLTRFGLQYLRNDLKARPELSRRACPELSRRTQARLGEQYKALPRLAGFTLAFLYSPPAFAALSMLALGVHLFGFPINRSIWLSQRSSDFEIRNAALSPSTILRLHSGHGSGQALSKGPKYEVHRWPFSLGHWVFAVRRSSVVGLRTYLTMAAHSAHYFAFGYGVLDLFAERYGFPVASLGLVYTAGWLGYYLISRLLPPSPRYLAWGHLASALGILVLAVSPAPGPALLAWTATGFGGGTIFMLARLRNANPYNSATMDLWDNGANVIGLLLFLGAWGRGVPAAGFLMAASLALVAAWLAAGLRETPHTVTAEQWSELVQSRARVQG